MNWDKETVKKIETLEGQVGRLKALEQSLSNSGLSFPTDNLFNGRIFTNTTLNVTAYYSSGEFSGPVAGWYLSGSGATDNFNRANNATTMGKSAGGNYWLPSIGTWGISGNKAYCVSDTSTDLVWLQSGLSSDFTAQVTISGTLNNAANFRLADLIFHGLDTSNYLIVQLQNGTVALNKRDGGVGTSLASVAQTTLDATDYTVTVVGTGYDINVYVNGLLKITHALVAANYKYALYSLIGLRLAKSGAPATAARWDNFLVRQSV